MRGGGRQGDVVAEQAAIERLVDGRTLLDAFEDTVAAHPERPALRWKTADGWGELTWSQFGELTAAACRGLGTHGFPRGACAVILARNRAEHVVADLAVLYAGGIPVSAYNTLAPGQLAYVVNHCGAAVAFVEDSFLDTVVSLRDELPTLRQVFVIGDGDPGDRRWVRRWDELLADGRSSGQGGTAAPAAAPEDPVTLMFTSGTTGRPKAVAQTHRSVLWTVESLGWLHDVGHEDRVVSYLPMAHSAERWSSYWRGLARGCTTWLCPDPSQLVPTMLAARPTWFLGVPRIWEKLRAFLQATGSGSVAAVGLDRCTAAASGGAPIAPDVVEFFHSLGLPLSEGWGMTEFMVGTWAGPAGARVGSVGPPLPGVEARLAGDGELLVRGGQMMAGYWNDRRATDDAFTADGFLRTGDVAERDEDGYYRIVDRKKDIIITSGGKNVAPAHLESLLCRHPLVAQACVVGDGRPYLCALVVPDAEAAPVPGTAELEGELERVVAEVNAQVSSPEQIKRFRVVPTPWSIEGEELTPTLKLRRQVVERAHAPLIEEMYR